MSNQEPEHTLFHERQRLHENPILRIVLPLCTLVVAVVIIASMADGSGSTPTGPKLSILIALSAFVGLGLPALLVLTTLETLVTDRRLVIRFRPFPGRDVPIEDITKARALRYRPIADAGGWGWRLSPKFHYVFNVSGNRGVLIDFNPDGNRRFLVGSRRDEELASAIDEARALRGLDPVSISDHDSERTELPTA